MTALIPEAGEGIGAETARVLAAHGVLTLIHCSLGGRMPVRCRKGPGLLERMERFCNDTPAAAADAHHAARGPAIGGRVKTGQWTASGTKLFDPAEPLSSEPVFVRQLLGPHFSKCPW